MDAAQALADLTEISSQIREAALELLREGERLDKNGRKIVQLDASTQGGSLFVVRDGERVIAATTRTTEPTVGLVFYDLKAALRSADADGEEPKPRRPRRKKDDDGEA